jgi:hypothetical protein
MKSSENPDLAAYMKKRRLKWLGHVIERVPKKTCFKLYETEEGWENPD